MTRRERNLGLIFLASLALALLVWLAQAWLEKTQKIDAELGHAERRLASYQLSLKNRGQALGRKTAWSEAEAVDEVFLKKLDSVVKTAGWRVVSAQLKSKRERSSIFIVSLEGRADRWASLLDALAAWDRPVALNALEASAAGKGRMAAQLEIGYEGR